MARSLDLGTLSLWVLFFAGGIVGFWPVSKPAKAPVVNQHSPIHVAVKEPGLTEARVLDPTEPAPVTEPLQLLPQPGIMETLVVVPSSAPAESARSAPVRADSNPVVSAGSPEVKASQFTPRSHGALAGVPMAVDSRNAGSGMSTNSVAMPSVTFLKFGEGEGRQPTPTYPRLARRQRQEGTVLVQIRVNADGGVAHADIVRACRWPLLNDAALDGVRNQWRFQTGQERLYEVEIRFELTP